MCDSCLKYDQWIRMSDEQWRKHCHIVYEIPDDICERCGRANDNKQLTICTSCEHTVFPKGENSVSYYFTTVGLHDGNFELEILIHSSATTKEEAEKIGGSDKFHIGYLYNDKLIIKGETLTINRDQTDKYQFRVCREWKPVVSYDDYEDLSWDEAIKYLIEEEKKSLPFTLESYYFGTYDTHPFAKNVLK